MILEGAKLSVRTTEPSDFGAIESLCKKVYPGSYPWNPTYLAQHREHFPEGQCVALMSTDVGDRVVGMSASLILKRAHWPFAANYGELLGMGTFSTHCNDGETLYGAEVMVDPEVQRRGVGRALYRARRELCVAKGLARIEAGARLPGYQAVSIGLTLEEYVDEVVRGLRSDATLSFQLSEGFTVLGVVRDYIRFDEESDGAAAIIEWKNPGPQGTEGGGR